MDIIRLLQMKTADTAHTGIDASMTRPFAQFFWQGLRTRLYLWLHKINWSGKWPFVSTLYSACNHSVYTVCTQWLHLLLSV